MNVTNEKYKSILIILKKKPAWYFAKVIDIFAMHKMICLCDWQDGSLCDCNVR